MNLVHAKGVPLLLKQSAHALHAFMKQEKTNKMSFSLKEKIMCNEKKDFSLLRPFDLDAAKDGQQVCYEHGGDGVIKYLDGPDNTCRIAYEGPDNRFYVGPVDAFRMAPLCWLEGSPVYKGDALYDKEYGERQVVRHLVAHDTLATYQPRKDGAFVICLEDATWTPPKVKRKVSLLGFIHCSTKEVLLREKSNFNNKVFWERFPQIDTTIEIEE